MDRPQIALVQQSFALVQPIAPVAAALFYDNLFAADPSLRLLFRGDMVQHGQRLMTALGAAVRMLDRPVELTRMLRTLGTRHASYGAQRRDYETVGGVLLQTLHQGLGDAWTLEVRAAWAALYAMVSGAMLEGAEDDVGVAEVMIG